MRGWLDSGDVMPHTTSRSGPSSAGGESTGGRLHLLLPSSLKVMNLIQYGASAHSSSSSSSSAPPSAIEMPSIATYHPVPVAPPEIEVREHLLAVDPEDDLKPETKFRIRGLTRTSDDGLPILSKIDVDIPRGKIVGIIGPSGSGKSTLLRALNRLWEPPSGTVFLDGEDICALDVLGLRRKVGMLFQLPAMFEGTVADNIRYGPQLRGEKLSVSEIQKLLSLADLDASFTDKNGGDLSVGQAQRVALARTLANEPDVLLLDEPTSALDPISTQNIEDALVKLKNSRRMTVVMVSHSIKQIQRVADVVCLLVNGEIVEVLSPNKLSEAKHPMALRFLELSS